MTLKSWTLASTTWRATRRTAGFLLVFAAFSGRAFAAVGPEIDPGWSLSAMTLLVGGLILVVNGRRRN